MDNLLAFLKKLVPVSIFRVLQGPYHYGLGFLAHVWYGMPSKKMYVIGVTGTKGKTTTVHLIASLFEELSLEKNVGMTSSVQFRVGGEGGRSERVNDTKQGMPGRFQLQKLLKEMKSNGCKYAVIETTSEGMLQYRHRFIDYNMAVFTNLSPEHIERHGGFEGYRDTKVKLFQQVARKKDGVGVYNLDDENVEYFLKPKVSKKIGFLLNEAKGLDDKIQISKIKLGKNISEFDVNPVEPRSGHGAGGTHFKIPLIGEFNVYNAAGAIAAVSALGFSLDKLQSASAALRSVEGRLEIVQKEPFTVIVDYAHEPKSLEELYKAAEIFKKDGGKLIGLLGSQGGGRDRWKRAEMGKIAARYCGEIVLSNEDPYDEDPMKIIEDVEKGVLMEDKGRRSAVYKILDRREGIQKAISLANNGDVVVFSAKGGEVWMVVGGGKKIPWDERKVVEEALS
ncbi:hypothetical protein CL629_02590 [bacterium]|nr:hypothetical protein [bacterium]|tara:strand:+ start:728 stop:2080 length:1353 start_codon:yes stop_codon:yes gene_type:complete